MYRIGISRSVLMISVFVGSLTASSPVTHGKESTLHERHARLARQTTRVLDRLFATAKRKELLAEADALAKIMVHFSEDHETAREWLGYEREGELWKGPEKPVAHENASEKGRDAFVKSRDKKMRELAKKLWNVLDKAEKPKKEGEPGTPVEGEARWFLLDDIGVLAPDDKRMLAERTLIRRHGSWITTDSLKTQQTWDRWYVHRNAYWKTLPKTQKIELPPILKDVTTLKWTAKVKVGDVPVWGTCTEREAEIIAQQCLFAASTFAYVFGFKRYLPQGFGVIVLTTREQRFELYKALDLDTAIVASTGAGALPGTKFYVSARWQGGYTRVDSTLRMLHQTLYARAFKMGSQSVWAAQGVGLLLTYIHTGTRLTIMGSMRRPESALGRKLERKLFKMKANWFHAARDAANNGQLPSIDELAPQSVQEIYVVDMVACNAYAMYFLTVYPDKAPVIFRRLGKGEKAVKVVKEELAMSLTALDRRLHRWLNDHASLDKEGSKLVPVKGAVPR